MNRLVWISSAVGTVVLSASYRQKLYKSLPDYCKEICALVQDWFIGGKQAAAETVDREVPVDSASAASCDRIWAKIFYLDSKTWLVIAIAVTAAVYASFRKRRYVTAGFRMCLETIGNCFAYLRACIVGIFRCCFDLFCPKRKDEEEPIYPAEQAVIRSASPTQISVQGDAHVTHRKFEADIAIDLGSMYHGYAYVIKPAKSVVQRKSEYKHDTGYIAPKQMSVAFKFLTNSTFYQAGEVVYGIEADKWLDRCLTSRGNIGVKLPLDLKACCSKERATDSSSTETLYLPAFWNAIIQTIKDDVGEQIDENCLHVTVVAANINNQQPGSSEFAFSSWLLSRLQERQVSYMRDTDAAALQVFHEYGDRHLRKMQRYVVVNFGGHHCSMGVYDGGKPVDAPVETLAMGGSHVTEELLTLIQRAIGEDVMQEFRDLHPSSWDSIEHSMEKRSDTLVMGKLEEFLFEKKLLHGLEGGLKINSFGGRLCLCLPEDMMNAAYAVIMESSFVQRVCDYIQRDSSQYVFVVGGFANEKRIKQFVKNRFSKEIIFPTDLESYPMLGGCLPK